MKPALFVTLLSLLSHFCCQEPTDPAKQPQQMRLISKFNRSMCTKQSLEAIPIRLIYSSRKNVRVPVNRPYVLGNFNLQKYAYIDTDFVPNNLGDLQESILRNTQTPHEVFEEHRIVLENYMMLTEKQIKITLVNPTTTFRICIHRVFVDSPQVELKDKRQMPFCINPHTKYPMLFSVFIQEYKNRYLRASVFFQVELNDTVSGKLVEHKIWAKDVVVSIHNNWLKVGRIEIEEGVTEPVAIEIRNPFEHELSLQLSSNLLLQSDSFSLNDRKNFVFNLHPGAPAKISLQPFRGHISLSGTLTNPSSPSSQSAPITAPLPLDPLLIPVVILPKFSIDNLNIGIITNKRNSVETLLTVTNAYNQSVMIEEVEVYNNPRTAVLRKIENLTNTREIKPMVAYSPIALIRVYSSVKEEAVVKTTIRIRYSVGNQKGLRAEMEFHYAEIHNPLSNIDTRYIRLGLPNHQKTTTHQNRMFTVKNSLNLPLKLTTVIIDQTKFKVSWVGQNRELIYPNQQTALFGFQYLQYDVIHELPVVTQLMILQFNSNLLIPVEIVLYDNKLECSSTNFTARCARLTSIDMGSVRSGLQATRDFKIRNPNPMLLRFNITLVKNSPATNFSLLLVDDIEQKLDNSTLCLFLKPKNNITIKMTIRTSEQTNIFPQLLVRGEQQEFKIKLLYRITQGTLTLFPNPLTIIDTLTRQVNYLYIESTLSESYCIINITTNDSCITFYYDKNVLVPVQEMKALPFINEVSQLKARCCDQASLLEDLRQTSMALQPKAIQVTINTSSDILLTGMINIVRRNLSLLPFTYTKFDVIQSTVDNQYSISLFNPYDKPVTVRALLVDPQIMRNISEARTKIQQLNQRKDIYICLSESAKNRLKMTPQIIKALFQLDNTPMDIFVQPLENGSFYLHWLKKNKVRSHQELVQEISEDMVNNILGGARYCYKSQAASYFQLLVASQTFNRIAQDFQPNVFFQFVERQYQHFTKPVFSKKYDPFYQNIHRQLNAQHWQLFQSQPSPCLFRFCQYTPIRLTPSTQQLLLPNQSLTLSLSLMQINESQQVSLVVLNNASFPEQCLLEFKVTRVLLRVEGLILYNIAFTKEEFINHYLSDKEVDVVRNLPIYMTFQENRDGVYIGERIFVLKNYGTSNITIKRMVFEDTMECSNPMYRIKRCTPFTILPKQTHNLSIIFLLRAKQLQKSIPLYLYSDKFFYKLIITSYSNQPPKSMNIPTSEQQLYACLFITLASIVYIIKVLGVITEEDVRDAKVRPFLKTSSQNLQERKQQRVALKLPVEYLNRFVAEQKAKQKSVTEEGTRKFSEIDQQAMENLSHRSVSAKDEASSYDELKSYEKSESGNDVDQNKSQDKQEDQSPGSNSSLSSGSSVSAQFLAQINQYAFGRSDRDNNSDANEVQSSHSSSNQFYDVFRSQGPLKKKVSQEEVKSEQQDDDLWLIDKTAQQVVKALDEDYLLISPSKRRSMK